MSLMSSFPFPYPAYDFDELVGGVLYQVDRSHLSVTQNTLVVSHPVKQYMAVKTVQIPPVF